MAEWSFTRRELSRLSGFSLPPAAGRRRVVPGLTIRQIRHLERYGAFDVARLVPGRVASRRGTLPDVFNGTAAVPVVVRSRPRGLTRLYTLADVATARLAAWMLRDGLTYPQIIAVLVGQSLAALLAERYVGKPASGEVLYVDGARGVITVPAQMAEWRERFAGQTIGAFAFPIAWLGVSASSLPQLQRERGDVRAAFPVSLHGRPATVAAIEQYAREVERM